MLNDRQLSTVLAALRYWQDCGGAGLDPEARELIEDIATNGGSHEKLSSDEIDELCEELNTGRPA